MNPPYPGSQGDGRPPSSAPPNPPSNPFHLPHHPHPTSLHPLHGGAGSLLHGGPPLPPPLPSSLGQVQVQVQVPRASPHLPGSILHPPRGLGPSVTSGMGLGLGMGMGMGLGSGLVGSGGQSQSQSQGQSQGLNQGQNQGTSSVMMTHPVRLPAPSLGQAQGPVKQETNPYGRPPSPRREPVPKPNQSQAQGQSQGHNQGLNQGLNQSQGLNQGLNQSQSQGLNQSQSQSQGQSQGTSLGSGLHYAKEDDQTYYSQGLNMGVGAVPPPRHRELRVEDALLYLDQVKQQFGDQPDIYNQFLDVMKDFKAQSIDTPGVIFRVSNLFRGYPNLILGFNTFLPPGYRIRPDTSIEVIPQQLPRSVNPQGMYSVKSNPQVQHPNSNPNPNSNSNANANSSMNQVHHRPPPVTIPPPYSPPNIGGGKPTSARQMNQGQSGQGLLGAKMGATMKAMPKKAMQPQAANPPQTAGGGRNSANPVEFDHAIHYVTTIKQRFADEPETYKEFLAILHTYQKEQRSIRQVLDQVSFLFRDHPDLLREFTFFLPDAVQHQAKERLERAAVLAQERKFELAKRNSFRDYPQGQRGGAMDVGMDAQQKRTLAEDREDGRHKIRRDDEHSSKVMERREKERERDRNKALFNHKRNKRRPHDTKERRQFLALSDVLIDKEEWGIFEKIKKILPSRETWREFLKCLELYSQEVLGRQELLSLVKNLFGRHTALVDEFDHILLSHGEHKDPNEIWPFIPLAETDLSQCRRATPSYRGLPASFPIAPCSFRSKMEKEVCNDSWVSVPTGSEDFSFKHMRKNQYEEALFRCEDERFEIDMAIDANASTISVLEPLAHEIEVLKEKNGGDEKLWNYVVDKGTFRITHLCAISRIYGESGTQILELLRKFPAGAIPIILKRLRQKDEEWRKARQDLNKQWKEVNEENYHKSLDHSSFYFKQKDKKQTSMKFLVQEAKTALEADEKTSDQKEDGKGHDAAAAKPDTADGAAEEPKKADEPMEAANGEAKPVPTWKPHFVYKLPAIKIHKDAFGLLSYAAEKNLGHADKEKVSKIWLNFFFPFFQFDEDWLLRKPNRANMSAEKAKMLVRGSEVSTDFGEGTVVEYHADRGVCEVTLPMGTGFLQLNTITLPESSDFPDAIARMDDEQKSAESLEAQKSVHFGAQHEYVFLRLYQMLHDRLERAYELCEQAKRARSNRTINPAARALDHARLASSETDKDKTGDYQAFLSKLYALIDGSIDSAKYEDCCRTLMGSKSFFLFTMEKLVTLVLKQMQHIATDSTSQTLLGVFNDVKAECASVSKAVDVDAYLNKAKSTFEGEGAFRMQFKPGVLRNTPLLAKVDATVAEKPEKKLWASSPRVHHEPSIWLVEPEIAIQYLGSVGDEDGEEEEEDNSPTDTPNATPPETPVFESPEHESADDAEAKQEDKPDTEQSGDDNMVGESSEEEDSEKKDSKKRARSELNTETSVKRVKVEEDEEEEKEEGEADENESEHETDHDVVMEASDNDDAKPQEETVESAPTSEDNGGADGGEDSDSPNEAVL